MSDKENIMAYWYIGLLPLEIRGRTGIDLDTIIETIETYSK